MCLGIPGQVVAVAGDGSRHGVVDVDGVRRDVSLALLDGDVDTGQWVLIHVGFALARIDEGEAAQTLALLREAGAAYAQEMAALRGEVV